MGVREWLTKSMTWRQQELPSDKVDLDSKEKAKDRDLEAYCSDEESNVFLRELQELASQLSHDDSDELKSD